MAGPGWVYDPVKNVSNLYNIFGSVISTVPGEVKVLAEGPGWGPATSFTTTSGKVVEVPSMEPTGFWSTVNKVVQAISSGLSLTPDRFVGAPPEGLIPSFVPDQKFVPGPRALMIEDILPTIVPSQVDGAGSGGDGSGIENFDSSKSTLSRSGRPALVGLVLVVLFILALRSKARA